MVTYSNGAVVPYDGANLAATAAHLATRGYGYGYPYAGYGFLYGRKKREAEADAQLVAYPNGAVVPYDGANQAATAAHLASKGLVYGYGYPYAGYGYIYGRKKREAEADAQLVAYPNGAVVPYDGANQAATAAHLASKGLVYGYGYPYAGLGYLYGRKKREADADAQLVAYPNGAVVPYDGANQAATAAHLASKGLAYGYGYPYAGYGYLYGRKKREAEAKADPQLLYGALPYAYGYAYAPYTPLVAHPNGALVPLEPAAVSLRFSQRIQRFLSWQLAITLLSIFIFISTLALM